MDGDGGLAHLHHFCFSPGRHIQVCGSPNTKHKTDGLCCMYYQIKALVINKHFQLN